MKKDVDVLYEKATNKVVAIRYGNRSSYGDTWIYPSVLDLRTFTSIEESEMMMVNKDGETYVLSEQNN